MRIHNPGGGSTSTWAARDLHIVPSIHWHRRGPRRPSRTALHTATFCSGHHHPQPNKGLSCPCPPPPPSTLSLPSPLPPTQQLYYNRNTNTQPTLRFLDAGWDPQHGPHLEDLSKAARRCVCTVHKRLSGTCSRRQLWVPAAGPSIMRV